MGFICILLPQKLTAVFFSVYFNDASVCIIRENKLSDSCYNTRIDHAAQQSKDQKDHACLWQYTFYRFHDRYPLIRIW